MRRGNDGEGTLEQCWRGNEPFGSNRQHPLLRLLIRRAASHLAARRAAVVPHRRAAGLLGWRQLARGTLRPRCARKGDHEANDEQRTKNLSHALKNHSGPRAQRMSNLTARQMIWFQRAGCARCRTRPAALARLTGTLLATCRTGSSLPPRPSSPPPPTSRRAPRGQPPVRAASSSSSSSFRYDAAVHPLRLPRYGFRRT